MLNLFDLARGAQGGAALDNMARQFGLSPDQTQRAVAFLLPALAMGLHHRAASDPTGLAQFFGGLAGNPMLAFFEQPGRAFTPQAATTGNALVDQFLGAPQLGGQVVRQASLASGIAGETLRAMLPVLAGLVAAGLVHAALNPSPGLFSPYAPPRPAPAPAPWSAPRSPSRPEPGSSTPGSSAPVFPWGDLVASLLGAPEAKPTPPEAARRDERASPRGAPRAAAERASEGASEGAAALALPFEAMRRLMQAGHEAQTQHLAALRGIFDTVWAAPASGAAPADGR